MQRTQWNDFEDEALRRCSWMARVIYLQVIRRQMDYETGLSGRRTVISYRKITEALDCTTHTTNPDPQPTKRMIQRAFESLERAGLVQWIKPDGPQKGIVFRCLLADSHQSAQKQAVPKRYPSGTQQAVPNEASNGGGLNGSAVPNSVAVQQALAVPPQESGNQTTPKPPSDWSIPDWINADAWEEFEAHRREIRKPLSNLARTKAANSLKGLSFAEQQACIDKSIQSRWSGLFPDQHRRVNGSPQPGQPPRQHKRSLADVLR